MVALHFRIGRTVLYGSTLGEGVAAVVSGPLTVDPTAERWFKV